MLASKHFQPMRDEIAGQSVELFLVKIPESGQTISHQKGTVGSQAGYAPSAAEYQLRESRRVFWNDFELLGLVDESLYMSCAKLEMPPILELMSCNNVPRIFESMAEDSDSVIQNRRPLLW